VACAGPLTGGHDFSGAHRVIGSHAEITLTELARALPS